MISHKLSLQAGSCKGGYSKLKNFRFKIADCRLYEQRPLFLLPQIFHSSICNLRTIGHSPPYNFIMLSDALDLFLPPVKEWFRTALGQPTIAQRQGWPAIAAGQHTLILAPTGSGKTLAAFLACLDGLWRQQAPGRPRQEVRPGVRILYVSPLKALNEDIHRNLQVPLAGVAETARRLGQPLPEIKVAVRTGDTSAVERQRLIRRPPHVLITTPESLHLLLTSQARETLRSITHCIVDEIHALCPNKRGVFLALLLERLRVLTGKGFVRIGLSATQRPLEEVARYLGGNEGGEVVGWWGSEDRLPHGATTLHSQNLTTPPPHHPRPVTIIDAGLRKDMDLRVVCPVEQFGPLPEKSVWPSIYRLLAGEIHRHKSTIVFANNRRAVERITSNLNDLGQSDSPPAGPLARAHHGSVSLEVRRETEQALKKGRLPAVVATASLELGIDMGAVDLVCQVESPGSVARGLQRVGRAGHLVGQKSKGRLIPKTPADLLEQAVLAREMAAGRVEEIRVPTNCLDVLAQQIVAVAAMDDWNVRDLYALVCRAYPYRSLTPQVFEAVLEMVSGRYRWPLQSSKSNVQGRTTGNEETGLVPGVLTALQPRVSWDRVHNQVLSLPGSKHLALVNGGTIPDSGQYAAYTPAGLRIGELDEEFIYERRVGEAFLLGTNAWKLEQIEADRVIVSPAEGAPAMVPFWRGEKTGRSYDLGQAMGRFLRELAERIDDANCLDWLQGEYFLDLSAAKNLCFYVRRQVAKTGCLPTDRTLMIEACRDHLGDWQVVVLSPLGSRLHFGLRLALDARLANRLGYRVQCLHHDDGILIRLADTEEPILDILEGITPENVEELILSELTGSALFALRFRQNAARALLMPRGRSGKRAPLWLQRLRSRDLLQVARQFPDFPIVAETMRECLHDHLDLPHLKELLAGIRSGQVQIVSRRAETPSPFAGSLRFAYAAAFMYQYDGVEPGPSDSQATLDRQLLEQLINPDRPGPLVDRRAVDQVEHRLRGLGRPPRSPTELAEWLRRLGDLSPSDLQGPMAAFLEKLEGDGRAKRLALPGCREPERWVLTEQEHLYRAAFERKNNEEADAEAAARTIFHRFLNNHALVGLADVLDRYPFDADWAKQQLEHWTQTGQAVPIPPETASKSWQWASPANMHQVQLSTLAILRHEVNPCPPHQFADFLFRWQRVQPASRQKGAEAFADTLDRLEGLSLPADLWEHTVFPSRVSDYQSRWLDESIASGEWVWIGEEDGSVAFWNRENLSKVHSPYLLEGTGQPEVTSILEVLRQRGASFVSDLAKQTNLAPSMVRKALWTLARGGQVSNDRFDVIRQGEANDLLNGGQRVASRGLARRGLSSPEGRWWMVPWGQLDPEENALFMVDLLLRRYGIVTRETALLDNRMPAWRVLYQVLSRMEMAGKIRRGYFVEGLSGVQFALPDASRQLQDCAVFSTGEPVILVHSLDPANLFGSSGPLKIPGHDNDNQAFHRRPGNWLVLKAGRPILLIEQQGKRLITPASADPDDLPQAVACLPQIFHAGRGSGHRHRITVEEWNGKPVTASSGRVLLDAAGFVRDYQGMTLYAGVRW